MQMRFTKVAHHFIRFYALTRRFAIILFTRKAKTAMAFSLFTVFRLFSNSQLNTKYVRNYHKNSLINIR